MARHVQLNNAEHSRLRVLTKRSAGLGDAVMSCPLFVHEFRQAQTHYPIVFARGGDGRITPLALFGFERGENLFLTEAGWDVPFLPAALRMQPFVIGRARDGQHEVHIDLDSPRLDEAGEPLFLEHGGQAPLLQEAARTLGEVAAGDQATRAFADLLTAMDLTEPFTLDVTLADGGAGRLAGLNVIAEERLASLGEGDLGRLQASGSLLPVFMAVASLSRFEDLVARRNARGSAT